MKEAQNLHKPKPVLNKALGWGKTRGWGGKNSLCMSQPGGCFHQSWFGCAGEGRDGGGGGGGGSSGVDKGFCCGFCFAGLDQPHKQPLQGDIFLAIPKNSGGWGCFLYHPCADPSQKGILQLLGLSAKRLGEVFEVWELCGLTFCCDLAGLWPAPPILGAVAAV